MESPRYQQELKLSDDLMNTFVCSNPWIGPIISVLYLILIKLLQKYMEDKPAYSLKSVIRIYNLIQVWACTKHVLMSFEPGWWWEFKEEYCAPNDFVTPFYNQLGYIGIVYFYLKVFDIFDTIFILLKKKNNQLSFLHLFHHCTMISATSYAIWDKVALLAPCILLNSLVHVVMYSYYFVASFNSQKWIINYKKYITQLQLTQFGLASVYLLFTILAGCQWRINAIIISFIILSVVTYEFRKFYIAHYSMKNKIRKN